MVIIKTKHNTVGNFLYNLSSLKKNNFNGTVQTSLFVKYFILNNKYHRYYGPACKWLYGTKQWWFKNECYGNSDDGYNQKQFLKNLNKQWL